LIRRSASSCSSGGGVRTSRSRRSNPR
jgi:hypothetical protein